MRRFELKIGGRTAPGRARGILSPFDGREVSQVPFADRALAEEAVATAVEGARVARSLPAHRRAAVLRRIS